ncbi:N-formylglutamate deformylase [Trinickia sp.]|uniref:N-formylglutamate deformylase n=1 Tax=Trinickia sp. TaxID=2571163 RepID=UPI003F8172E7
MTDATFLFDQGNIPLVVSIPHVGTEIPESLRERMTPAALEMADTDWHLDRLYAFARRAGASILAARFSRYVIDLNRPPGGETLYPGRTTTSLCPTETFRGEPVYREGCVPNEVAIGRRLDTYWEPYHACLRAEIDRLTRMFGHVLLWEAHSIASVLPRLFDGKLPDFNFGTNGGKSCAPAVVAAATATLAGQPYTHVLNGRFKGGYITRAFGLPEERVHAIQLEMRQSTYMDEASPFRYRPDLASKVSPVVERMVMAATDAVSRLSLSAKL